MTPPAPRSDRPIFLDLADQIADDILSGAYPPGARVPSTTELSVHFRINPATAGKAVNRLVDQGVLEKRRGVGMFVTANGPAILRTERQGSLLRSYVEPLLAEAKRLGMTTDDVVSLIRSHSAEQPQNASSTPTASEAQS
ncbi:MULTISPECIES: GntR family transcriptional regulator [Kocuria]|uniref:GntR family transcriptional regulator n=1 Tax=Kocuria subflava TaxID=1736139 RepID=A0A846U2S6_9MICC|nr:GntR family transcriptional regulator [Kocuria sp. CPCC 104605]NKE10755.1 GntR family transcriptional regulator [Kocuria subflava]